MKSLSEIRPEREILTTLFEESHATPSQEVQQSEELVHDCRSFEGSAVILCLNSSKASLSTALHALHERDEKKGEKRRKMNEKVLRQIDSSIDKFKS